MPVHKEKAGGRNAAPGFLRLNNWLILGPVKIYAQIYLQAPAE